MKKVLSGLGVVVASLILAACTNAQTITGSTDDAQIQQGSPNVVTAVGDYITVGYRGSSGAMGSNAVYVFSLPNLPADTGIITAKLAFYYGGKYGSPNYHCDLYGLNTRSSSTVVPSDYYMGSADPNAASALIQDNIIVPASAGGYRASTSGSGDTALVKYLNVQLNVSAASRASGSTSYVFLRLSPDVFGNTYTNYYFGAADNGTDYYRPKLTITTGPATRFAASSFWYQDIANAPLDADQSAATKLLNQFRQRGSYFSTASYGIPIYVVPSTQSTITVAHPNLNSYWGQVPWPPGATPAAGTDAPVVIWQPSTDKVWEFWRVSGTYPNIAAGWGGRIFGASTSPGIYPSPYGVSASGFSMLHSQITLDEATQIATNPNYTIPHAVNIAIPYIKGFIAPATRTDGSQMQSSDPNAIPEGRIFRLPPDYDVETSMANQPAMAKVLARTAKAHGLVVCDTTGSGSAICIGGEDPKSRTTNPWPAATGGVAGYNLFKYFPWDKLQVIAPAAG